jgi:hypothetical protein
MSKATPIEHLPNAPGSGNVQMQMSPDQMHGSQAMPPQPQQLDQYPVPKMPDGHQMYQQMSMDQEGHRANVQDNYMSRQFVQPPVNMGGQLPEDRGPPGSYPEQMPAPMRGPMVKTNDGMAAPNEVGIFQLLMMQSKTLSLVFALLVCVQLETTQGLFRKLTRMIKVPESMVFTASKVFAALVGVIVFFFVLRNL